jgi:hypothetical protein
MKRTLHYQIPYWIRKGYKGQHTVPVRDITELLQQKHTLSLFEMNGYKRKAQSTEVDKHMIIIHCLKAIDYIVTQNMRVVYSNCNAKYGVLH